MPLAKRRLLVLLSMLLILAIGGQVLAQDENISEELVNGNTDFAFELYQAIRAQGDNLIFSPFSISQALAMTYAGARGETEQQIAETMRFILPQDDLHPAFKSLMDNLSSRADLPLEEGQRMKLNIANALWGLDGYPYLEAYLQTLDANYGAGLQFADFINNPEGAREDINSWIEDQTEDRIQNIVPEGAITPLTRLVLANAIYFNATWLFPFVEGATQDAPFTLLDGSQIDAPMMFQNDSYRYMQGAGFQALELPYVGDDVAMLVILPDAGKFEAVESELSAGMFASILGSLEFQLTNVYFPRFEYEFDLSLSQILAEMGMTDAFDPNSADFSGMADLEEANENLFISDVLHKAFVKVDEEGTEAAAATVVIMEATSAMIDQPLEFRVDRPFIYTIYDKTTGSVLFMGRVLNPSA